MTTVAVDSIWVGERDRKPGDVSDLMESMTEVGLLHPIVVTPDNHLVAGGRRLEAARRLGWTEIDVTVIASLADAELALRAEMDENTCRRDLSPAEAERARKRRVKALATLAEKRVGGRGKKATETGTNLEPVSHNRKTKNVAAQGTGYSGSTLDKVTAVREIAEDETQPEPLREVAREAMAELEQPKAKVEPIHQRMIRAAKADNPIAAAKAEVAKQPAIVAGKAIDRFRLACMTVDAAGGVEAIIADLAGDTILDPDLWLADLDRAVEVAGSFASAIRRRKVRSVK